MHNKNIIATYLTLVLTIDIQLVKFIRNKDAKNNVRLQNMKLKMPNMSARLLN